MQFEASYRPQPAYALLSFGEYFTLNSKLSIAKGYDLTQKTQRVLTMNPPACKVDIVIDSEGNEVSFGVKLVAPISSEIQIDYPDLITEYELVDSYVPVDSSIQSIVVDLDNLDVLDWTLIQFQAAGASESGLSLVLSETTMSLLTPELIEQIQALGLNIAE